MYQETLYSPYKYLWLNVALEVPKRGDVALGVS